MLGLVVAKIIKSALLAQRKLLKLFRYLLKTDISRA